MTEGDAVHFAESVRLLWEGTRRAVYGGIDTDDLASLCAIVVRLADHRLLLLQSGSSSPGTTAAIEQLREYRRLALELLAWTQAPVPALDWSLIANRLALVD